MIISILLQFLTKIKKVVLSSKWKWMKIRIIIKGYFMNIHSEIEGDKLKKQESNKSWKIGKIETTGIGMFRILIQKGYKTKSVNILIWKTSNRLKILA